MDVVVLLLTFTTICLVFLWYIFGLFKIFSKLPPGPWGLPIFGYLFFINELKPHETISKLVSKYGKVFSMQMGEILCIVLADPETIRTVFSKRKYDF